MGTESAAASFLPVALFGVTGGSLMLGASHTPLLRGDARDPVALPGPGGPAAPDPAAVMEIGTEA